MLADDAETVEIAEENPAVARSKTGKKIRLLTLDDLDGRTLAARHVQEMRSAIVSDLGGEERLSVLERAATDHVALTAGMIRDVSVRWLQGQETDPANLATLVNAFNRTAAILGWQRRAKDISAPALRDYVATTYAAGGGK